MTEEYGRQREQGETDVVDDQRRRYAFGVGCSRLEFRKDYDGAKVRHCGD